MSASPLLSPSAIHAAAQILADRRLKGLAGPRLPDALRPPSWADAMAIQAAVSQLMGDAVAGWKCGTPGPDKLVVAPLYAASVHSAGAGPHPDCPAWAHEGLVRVEPELAFVLGCDLPVRTAPYTPHEVDLAIARTHLALELIDTRYSDTAELSFADKLADGLVNQGLFIGPQVDGDAARQTHAMPISIDVAGEPISERAGAHPDPLPRAPLYWLAEHLRATGVGMRAGQVVITGSYAGCFALPIGRAVSMRFGALGTLSVTLHARGR
jgi:2-keto-4-pentenoate hydratase